METDTSHITEFLQGLINSIDSKSISKQQMLSVIDFYVENNNDIDNINDEKNSKKYMFLGYYLYKYILNR